MFYRYQFTLVLPEAILWLAHPLLRWNRALGLFTRTEMTILFAVKKEGCLWGDEHAGMSLRSVMPQLTNPSGHHPKHCVLKMSYV